MKITILENVKKIGFLLFLIPFFLILYKIFSVRALSFGCFDDCANYITGYFVLHGKKLYTEIFFNHIMGMTYLSYFTQKLHHSINIYDLVLTHRKVILIFSFLFDAYLLKRFKWVGFFFVLFYETTKFYTFGDRFLGESLVIYAAVILVGFILEIKNKKVLSYKEYIIMGILSALIACIREPYIPLSITLLFFICISKGSRNKKIISCSIFMIVISLVLLLTDIQAFIFQDFIANSTTAIQGEIGRNKLLGAGILAEFFYPILILFYGKWNPFHFYLIGISIVFLTSSYFVTIKENRKFLLFMVFLILGISNMRYTIPGLTFYEAYHMQIFIGIFLFTAIYLATKISLQRVKVGLFIILIFLWGYAVFNPGSYIYDKHNLQEDLLTNFGKEMHIGMIIHDLSNPSDTLFLDGGDDLIYWQADIQPSYKYSWYTAIMPQIPIYRNERIQMFKNAPPDFYFDFCTKDAPFHSSLPLFVKDSYQQLYENGKPSCLYVKKTKISEITQAQWDKVRTGFFALPEVETESE